VLSKSAVAKHLSRAMTALHEEFTGTD